MQNTAPRIEAIPRSAKRAEYKRKAGPVTGKRIRRVRSRPDPYITQQIPGHIVGTTVRLPMIVKGTGAPVEYDKLNRLVKAKGIYGRHDYTYSTSGNLTTNNYGILEYKDTTHPNAVTKDGRDNIYVYDARGNMVIRGEQSLKYNAENRLAEISRNNTAIQQNYYDHTGHRVLKKLSDGTHVYNINGLYELGQKAGYADTHTKYIYGMKGDIAAQVTKESSKVKKTRFYSGTLYDGRYHSNGAVRLASAAIIAVNEFTDTPGNIWKVERWVIGTLALSLILLILYSSKKRGITILRLPQWTEAISMLLVITLVTSMTLTGCTGGDIPGVSDDTEDTENAVTDSTGAIPAKGLYYFHPDHVGSISYLTDSTGKIVSKMNYTPYGEVIKSKSTGTDLFNKKYTGQTYDASSSMKEGEEDTGLCYYNARYYDPGIGRFISADSVVPDAGSSQAYNRYMYVVGNPVKYRDKSGHFSVGGVASAIVGGIIGGTNGASAAYAGYKAYSNRDKIKDKIKETAKNIYHDAKNFIKDHRQEIFMGIGGHFGGPIGALYGYAAGSNGGIEEFWKDHQWFRITTYVIITVAVVVACIFAPVIAPALGAGALNGLLYGSIIGTAIGGVYGGTNGFQGGWNWEMAAQGMMKGAIIGAIIGFTAGSFYDFMMSPTNIDIFAGKISEELVYGGIPGEVINGIYSLTQWGWVTQYGYLPLLFYMGASFQKSNALMIKEHEFTYLPFVSYNFDNNDTEVFGKEVN